jgi:Bacterial TSP3 repeat
MTQRPVKSLFAALAVAGVLLAPATANALPPLPGDLDADDLSDQYERDVSHTKPDDRDTDKDGLNDGNEVQNVHSNPLSKDTDGDGFSDYAEYVDANDRLDPLRFDPKDAPAGPKEDPDTDQDGLFNDDETNVYGTNPNKADSDGDGRDDGQEVFDKTDPNNPFD